MITLILVLVLYLTPAFTVLYCTNWCVSKFGLELELNPLTRFLRKINPWFHTILYISVITFVAVVVSILNNMLIIVAPFILLTINAVNDVIVCVRFKRCPLCGGWLSFRGTEVTCGKCGEEFDIDT